MILSTLDRYIGKSMLGAIFATLFALVGLSGIIKFVEQFSKIGRGTYDMAQAALYTILTMPKDVETFFPMAALLGALIALGNLARTLVIKVPFQLFKIIPKIKNAIFTTGIKKLGLIFPSVPADFNELCSKK